MALLDLPDLPYLAVLLTISFSPKPLSPAPCLLTCGPPPAALDTALSSPTRSLWWAAATTSAISSLWGQWPTRASAAGVGGWEWVGGWGGHILHVHSGIYWLPSLLLLLLTLLSPLLHVTITAAAAATVTPAQHPTGWVSQSVCVPGTAGWLRSLGSTCFSGTPGGRGEGGEGGQQQDRMWCRG